MPRVCDRAPAGRGNQFTRVREQIGARVHRFETAPRERRTRSPQPHASALQRGASNAMPQSEDADGLAVDQLSGQRTHWRSCWQTQVPQFAREREHAMMAASDTVSP